MEDLQTLQSGRPLWASCLIASGLFLLVGFVLIAFFAHGMIGSPVEFLKNPPPNFPKDISLFQVEKAVAISYTPAKKKNALVQFIVAPLRLLGDVVEVPAPSTTTSTSEAPATDAGQAKGLLNSANMPGLATDTATFVWRELDASVAEALAFYAVQLKSNGFVSQALPSTTADRQDFVASRPDAIIHVEIEAPLAHPSPITQIVVTVTYLPTN